MLGLHCCPRAFSRHSEWGLLLIAFHGFLIVMLLFLQSRASRQAGFSSCRVWAQQLWHTGLVATLSKWGLPRPGIKPLSSALAGRFLTTGPPGKSHFSLLIFILLCSVCVPSNFFPHSESAYHVSLLISWFFSWQKLTVFRSRKWQS